MCGGRIGSIAALAAVLAVGAGNCFADVFHMPAGDVSLSLLPVTTPSNMPDPATGNLYGSVAYDYNISKFDTTVAQYTAFLNATATVDQYGEYNGDMSPLAGVGSCGITRVGTAGSYSYSFAPANANFPVDSLSWAECARFCNWLANGQPDTGVENLSTTESGSYFLNGALTDGALAKVTRSSNATYVIPTENEYYKAAFYNPKTGLYFAYPTSNNNPPTNSFSSSNANGANFYDNGFSDPTNILTSVGAFQSTTSPWGEYDMGGNVFEYTETEGAIGDERILRGGSFNGGVSGLLSSTRLSTPPSTPDLTVGFRIAEVPEPSSIAILGLTGIGVLRRRRK
jgi:formylglycine-generating enzyme